MPISLRMCLPHECPLKALFSRAPVCRCWGPDHGPSYAAEDCFAEHHRVEAARDLKVLDAVRLGDFVEFVCKRIAIVMKAHEELLKFAEGLPRRQRSGGINLDAIARGKDNGFFRNA
jgi:hypothetical protein